MRVFNAVLGLTLLGLLASASPATAQVQYGFGGHFLLALPQGEFDDNVDNLGYGGSLFGTIGPGAIPIQFGLEGGVMIYGSERRRVPLSTTIPDVTVEVTTSNNFFLGHALLRFQPQGGAIRPYADAFVGLNHLATETSVEDEDSFDDDRVFSSTNFSDTGFSYGAGGGVMIRLGTAESDSGKPFDIMLDLRTRYIIGGEVEYLREGSISRDGGEVQFDPILSKTDTFLIQVGVAIMF